MIGAAIPYALKPDRRFVPLQVGLGIMTLVAGSLGFVTGLIKSLGAIHRVPEGQRFIWLLGLGFVAAWTKVMNLDRFDPPTR